MEGFHSLSVWNHSQRPISREGAHPFNWGRTLLVQLGGVFFDKTLAEGPSAAPALLCFSPALFHCGYSPSWSNSQVRFSKRGVRWNTSKRFHQGRSRTRLGTPRSGQPLPCRNHGPPSFPQWPKTLALAAYAEPTPDNQYATFEA